MTRTEQREARRARLLAATWMELADRGFRGASVARIAAQAGVTTGTIYSQFDGKADLFRTAMSTADPLLSWPLPAEGEDVHDYLRSIAAALFETEHEAAAQARLILRLQARLLGEDDVDDQLSAAMASLVRDVVDVLASHLRELGLPQPDEVAFTFNALLFSAGVALFGRHPMADPATVRGALDAFISSLSAR